MGKYYKLLKQVQKLNNDLIASNVPKTIIITMLDAKTDNKAEVIETYTSDIKSANYNSKRFITEDYTKYLEQYKDKNIDAILMDNI